MTLVKLNSPWEMLGSRSRRLKIAEQGCVSGGRQLRQQDLKNNNMEASEDGRGVAVAGALGKKISQQERGIRSVVGRRQEKIAAGARQKQVRQRQVKITAGARRKLALSSTRASMLLGSKLRGGRLMQQ